MTVEVPGASIPSTATVATGTERDELLQQLAETLPGMSDYISATNRKIPIVILNQTK